MPSPTVPPAPALTRLDDFPVFLSASLPKALEGTPQALDLQGFLVAFIRGLFSAGGRLIFGGHPSVTPLVQRVASDFSVGRIELFQLEKYRAVAPPEVNRKEFVVHWIDSDDLAPMRDQMVERARAGVFVGGKTRDEMPIGGVPGIRDEHERFLKRHPEGPAYLLGLLAGEAAVLIRELNGAPEPNQQSAEERELLHETNVVDLAAALVLADLRRAAARGGPPARYTQEET
ncbi:MAG: hypothetical protein GY835_09645 [bacterium]|nr:hypothetical protein [bacterium]